MKFFADERADTNYPPFLAVYRTQELPEGNDINLRRKEEVESGLGALFSEQSSSVTTGIATR